VLDALVVVRPNGNQTALLETLEALQEHTPELKVWYREAEAADCAGEAPHSGEGGRVAACVPADRGIAAQTFVTNVIASFPETDVVLLEAGVSVGLHWLDKLREAAFADSAIATASAVPGSALGLGNRDAHASSLDVRAAGGVAVSRPVRGCVYVRRDAMRIAMAARSISSEGLARFDDIEDLLLLPGLVHVLGGTAIAGGSDIHDEDAAELATPAIRRALGEVRVLREALPVAVDLRCCAIPVSGTQVHALQLAAALAAKREVRLTALVPERPHASARAQLDALASVAHVRADVDPSAGRPLVLHRPYQVFFEGELADVLSFGERLVITHQDMLLDYTPEYFRLRDRWRRYAESTALSLAAADEVVFFSEHARESALRNRLVDRAKTSVVPPGTDHLDHVSESESAPARLARAPAGNASFVLVFGHAYPHKNRIFALAVAEELRARHDWTGFIILAGGRPTAGSSVDGERLFLGRHRDLQARFVDLGPVSEAERSWLYGHASLVLSPTLYEGFGLVPFEAASAGTACLYSPRSSVAEYLPPEGAVLDLGDVAKSAGTVAELLRDREARLEIVEAIRSRASALTWERAATAYVRIYERAISRPPGFAMLAGDQIVLTHRSELPTSETERYALVALRSSRALRTVAGEVLSLAAALHRRVRRT
jgi:glycosyltransferase involved in cell wall biosynthesis